MNKKKLSVVMAGAMLASSVAPVLAAEVQKSEMSADNLGLLIRDLRAKLNSAKFADEEVNKTYAGKSIYQLKIKGEDDFLALDADSTQQQFQNEVAKIKAGDVVEVWTKDHVVKDEKYYAYTTKSEVYTTKEIEELANKLYENPEQASAAPKAGDYATVLKNTNKAVYADGKLNITFIDSGLGTTSTLAGKTIYLTKGSKKIDFDHYTANDGTTKNTTDLDTNGATDFREFPKVAETDELVDTGEAKVEEITITSGGNNLSVEDIYDGLMLTTKGHDFFKSIDEAETLRGKERELYGNLGVDKITDANLSTAIGKVDGKCSFTVKVPNGNGIGEVVYTVTGTNEEEVERLASWVLAKQPKVDILAGLNRYATAVTIAKEYAGLTDAVATTGTNNGKANIVLVNGESLVDGLAAAPLAAAKTNNVDLDGAGGKYSPKEYSAPVLLTESDRLPKETRAYLKDVIGKLQINSVKNATIHIVGGEAVVSKGIERELKSLGFSVERYGGDNREETSLEVADAIGTSATTERFVVGAEGEADAMSIAPIASTRNTGKVTPIIVAKKGGITEDALYELRDTNVTIIGGEKAVSKSEEEEIGLEATKVSRISGENRQATNAEIISKYYTKSFGKVNAEAKNVVVAKDGQHNKLELVDALAAANFASEKQAPIVLATNKLSDAQINALELNAQKAEALYQVGIGVDKDNVVKIIAQRLGLANAN